MKCEICQGEFDFVIREMFGSRAAKCKQCWENGPPPEGMTEIISKMHIIKGTEE